jgi:peptidase E
MAKIYFLGGERILKKDAKQVNVAAFADAGGSPRVLVFPWARPSFDAIYRRRRLVKRYFCSLGAQTVKFCEFPYIQNTLKEQLAEADVLYFTGGQVSVLLNRLTVSGLDSLLCSYKGVIVGRSAGAMVFGKNCLVTRRYNKQPAVVKGLSIVDFSIKAHYTPTKDQQLMELANGKRVYAIPERSALAYDEGHLSVFGEVFLFENGTRRLIS